MDLLYENIYSQQNNPHMFNIFCTKRNKNKCLIQLSMNIWNTKCTLGHQTKFKHMYIFFLQMFI